MLRKELRKKARKARRDFAIRVDALPKSKTIQRPVVKKRWIDVKVGEDREEWMEEVKARPAMCDRKIDVISGRGSSKIRLRLWPLRKMLRRQGRDDADAGGSDSKTTTQKRQSCSFDKEEG